jgi:hypothetical protein
LFQGEELPGVIDSLAAGERPHHGQGLVQPPAPGRRVHTAVADLCAVLAANPGAENQAPGRRLADGSELPGRKQWVPQAQQVNPDDDLSPSWLDSTEVAEIRPSKPVPP